MMKEPCVEGSTHALSLSQNAEALLEARYFLRNEAGKTTEDFHALIERVVGFLATAEAEYGDTASVLAAKEQFRKVFGALRLVPSSPILMNAATASPMLGACFVLPIEDSMESILETHKNAMLIHKQGGGTGFSFSRLRPAGSRVAGTNGVASGPVSFIEMFNAGSEAVKQGGRRRGANLAVLRVDYPDVLSFIEAKLDTGRLENFNLSVAITDAFMAAVEADEPYSLIDPRTGEAVREMPARQVFSRIAECAWRCGDPGVIFIDEINRGNPLPSLGPIEATNPCGEQPLEPWGVCCLASVNLSAHVRDGSVDWEALGKTARIGVRLLDDAIDVSAYPFEQNESAAKTSRKIGLGVMGLAHMLAKLRVPYDSEEGVELAGKVMQFISEQAVSASRQLAKERGPFPTFGESVYARRGEPPRRNATVTTVAPTGTTSIIADTSSGIEPIYALAYTRPGPNGKDLSVVDPVFREMATERGIDSGELLLRVTEKGSVQAVSGVPDYLKKPFKCAYEVAPEWHVRMQAEVQKHTENGVSKTVNLPLSATVEDVKGVFRLAHELGCKGVTVFRRGCRAPALKSGLVGRRYIRMRERPKVVSGRTEKFRTGCGTLYVHVNHVEEDLLETFSNLGKGGGCPAQSEAMSRLVSLCLRCEVDPAEVVRQLRGIRCPSACAAQAKGQPVDVLSCPDGIAQAISSRLGHEEGPEPRAEDMDVCPKCGGEREPGRCGVCLSCWEGGCEPV